MSQRHSKRILIAAVAAVSTSWIAAQEPAPLIGTIVDPGGTPLAGVVVEAFRAEGEGMGGLDLDYNRSYRRIARTPTGKRGGFAMQLPRGLPCQLRVDHPPFARWTRDQVLPSSAFEIRLQTGATFTGTVVMQEGGAGAPARLRAWDRNDHTEVFAGRTDDSGAFRFERVMPASIRVSVEPDAAASPAWFDVELAAGEVIEQRVEVDSGIVLRGRVIDKGTGAPIAGAEIGEGWVLHKKVRTDADGRYEMRGFGSSGYQETHCRAPGYVKQVVVHKDKVAIVAGMKLAEKPLEQDFRLERGLGATGRVVDPAGAALAGVYVAVVGMVHDGETHYHDWVATRTDDRGRFRVRGLRRDLDHVVLVRRDGWATLVHELPGPDDEGVRGPVAIEMRRPRLVVGRAIDGTGAPVGAIKVGLWGTNDDLHRFVGDAGKIGPGGGSPALYRPWELLRRYVAMREVRTDAQGWFEFGDVPPGEFHLVAYDSANNKIGRLDEFEVNAEADPEPLQIVVER